MKIAPSDGGKVVEEGRVESRIAGYIPVQEREMCMESF